MSKLIEKLLWIYIILLPMGRLHGLPLLNQKLQYADLLFVILFIIWIIDCAKNKFHLKWNRFDLSVLFLLIAYSPSFYNAKSHLNSVIELSGLIYLAVLYFLVKNVINTKEKFISFAKIWVATGVIVSMFGMLALAIYRVTGKIGTSLQYTQVASSYHMLPRIKFLFCTPNMYASYILVGIIFAFILLHHNFENKKTKSLIVCALAIMFLGAFFSASRQQTGIYLSSFLILTKFKKSQALHILKRLLFLGFIVLLFFGFLTTVWTIVPINFKNDIEKGIFKVEINSKYSWHIFTQHASINMIKRKPILGVGLGNYGDNFTEYVDWKKAESSYYFILPSYERLVKDRELILDPLSTYLGSFAETGLVGFTALLVFLTSFALSLFNFYKNKLNNSARELSWFILSGFFGFLINGFIIEILTMRHLWIMMAMGMSITCLRDKTDILSNK